MADHDHHEDAGHGHGHDRQPDAHGQLDVREGHIGDRPAAEPHVGHGTGHGEHDATHDGGHSGGHGRHIPLAAVLAGARSVPQPGVGALLMIASTVVVAMKARLPRRVNLQRDTGAATLSTA